MLLNQDQDLLADLSIAICSSFHHHHNHHHHHRHHHFQVGNPGIDITAVVEDAILNAEDAVGLDALRRV